MQKDDTLRRGKTTSWVYRQIRELIIDKRLPPGSKINQNAMAGEMRISRTPVVNALHKLESEGLVDNVPHTGFFVHQITVKELLDLFALREALDTMIVTELVATVSDEEIRRLARLFEPFRGDGGGRAERGARGGRGGKGQGTTIDTERYRRADIRFHFTMLELCANTLARKVNENFQVFNRSFMGGLVRPPEETLPEHQAIIDALRSRNLAQARAAVVAHNNGTKAVLQELVVNMRKIGVDPEKIALEEFQRRRSAEAG
jgi:DNA-binding GntR family transcriptional regulator